MGFLKEFKEFSLKGNVVDLAVGVIIGAAFSKIVSSAVEDVITPLLLKPALEAVKIDKLENYIIFGSVKIGVFLAAVINFIIVAAILFLFIKGMNSLKRKEEAKAAVPPAEPQISTTDKLLMEIRDNLNRKA